MRILKYNVSDLMIILMFITSLHLVSKVTFITALIIWLTIVCELLGLLRVNKIIRTIR